MAMVPNGIELLPKMSSPEYRVHEHYRQTTNDRQADRLTDDDMANVNVNSRS